MVILGVHESQKGLHQKAVDVHTALATKHGEDLMTLRRYSLSWRLKRMDGIQVKLHQDLGEK